MYLAPFSIWWARVVITIAGVLLANSAIRHSLVETLPELNLSDIFPSVDSSSRRPLPSAGSLRSRFPSLTGTMRRSDSLPPVPGSSFPRPPIPACAPLFAPTCGERYHGRARVLVPRFPHRCLPTGDGRASQVPGGSLIACPASRKLRRTRNDASHAVPPLSSLSPQPEPILFFHNDHKGGTA